jgi:geranylgeranyl pyrophosphate synthase
MNRPSAPPASVDAGPRLESIHRYFEAQIQEIDRELLLYLEQFEHPRSHYGMIQYHFGYADSALQSLPAGQFLPRGKRLRPILCMLFCRMLQLSPDLAKTVMMATEVMHAASLAHDDIEDKDSVRWGRPTLNGLFGVEQAINVGDALIGMVYQILLGLRQRNVEPAVLLDVIETFNRTHVSMCEGQHLDLASKCYQDVTVAGYIDMVLRKTAAPCVCIADAISTLAACPEETRRTLRQFGESLGLLYQICDDMRGIWCDADDLGRQVGQDVSQQRASLPLLYGYKHGSPELRRLLGDGKTALGLQSMEEIRKELHACGVDKLCRDEAERHYRAALEALQALGREGRESEVLRQILSACFASVPFGS